MRGLVRADIGPHHVAERRRRRVRPDVGAVRSVDALSGDRHLCEGRRLRVDCCHEHLGSMRTAPRPTAARPCSEASPDAVSLVLLGRGSGKGAERVVNGA